MNNIYFKPGFYRFDDKISGLFLLFFITLFHSQSFTRDNPSLYIKENTLVYISDEIKVTDSSSSTSSTETCTEKGKLYIGKNTQVSGMDHLKNFELYKNKERSHRSNSSQKPAQISKVSKIKRKVSQVVIVLKTLDDRYAFGLPVNNLGVAVLNNISVFKAAIFKETFYFLTYNFIPNDSCLFFDYNSQAVSGILIFHYSRPPPTIISI